MTDTPFNKAYWDSRYQDHQIGWDLGEVSPPLKAYFDTLENKSISILIPGCGNSYEADYLLNLGFTNVTLIDISPTLVQQLQEKHKGNSSIKIVEGDFFEHQAQYDLIIEQTFFCALLPNMRPQYVEKMKTLLKPKGKIAGLLFDFPLTEVGPPFGGSKEEYMELFSEKFYIKTLEKAYNSIKPRENKELFFIFEVK